MMPSGAGHDAVYMARLAPAGMIFIPCKDGISHNEIEDAKPEHITAGCNVLLHAMLDRARQFNTRDLHDEKLVSLGRLAAGYLRMLHRTGEVSRKMTMGDMHLAGDSFIVTLNEGWRGEISHCLLTDRDGRIVRYKIKDPSFHNWTGLAMALRNQEISDFPLCNKSFNLSYCGFDL